MLAANATRITVKVGPFKAFEDLEFLAVVPELGGLDNVFRDSRSHTRLAFF